MNERKHLTQLLAVSAAALVSYDMPMSMPLTNLRLPRPKRGNKYYHTTDQVHHRSSNNTRKLSGQERNAPCECGSGIKAKKCKCIDGIVTFNHPALKSQAIACTEDEVKSMEMGRMIQKLMGACRMHGRGAGLAANQIGWLKRVIYIYPERTDGIIMINPEILKFSIEKESKMEGCLSYPGYEVEIERAVSIVVKWRDVNWIEHEQEFEDFPARVIQHEEDHLNGICQVGDAWRQDEDRKRQQP